MNDLAVRGRNVLVEGRLAPATVAIADGVITGILPHDAEVEAREVIDAGDDFVSPGFLDAHVHFDQPGVSFEDNYHDGSANAALGGHTFVIEHPFSDPVTTSGESFAYKMDAGARAVVIDFGLWGGLTRTSLEHLDAQRELGAPGFKAFLPENDMGFPAAREADLERGLTIARDGGGVVLVHAEDRDGLIDAAARLRAEGRTDIHAFGEARPPEFEVDAVRDVVAIAERTGAPVHFVHLSVPEAVDLVTAARARGVAATCEATAHHLLLDADDLVRIGPLATSAPPLRPRGMVEQMWQRLAAGAIHAVVSDHCPYSIEDKLASGDDVLSGPFGVQGVREFAPLFIGEAVRRGIALEGALALLTSKPADLFGYAHRKGSIAVGLDADLTILASRPSIVTVDGQLGTDRWTPFEGLTADFVVERTISRGRTVVAHGQLIGQRGTGDFVRAEPRVGTRS